jgi:hypothetical protein
VVPQNFSVIDANNPNIAIILGGVDGTGSVTACSDPIRVTEVLKLEKRQKLAAGIHLQHIYRRDDNSGTSDSVKEKLGIQNFCNGRARGTVGQTPPPNDTNGTPDWNLNNQDNDPIRRPCVAVAGEADTKCTDMTVAGGAFCKPSDNNPNCTQGLIVALSQGDPGISDITVSIGQRAARNNKGQIMGYSGREGARQAGSIGPTVNSITYIDANIRSNVYLFSRRLYLQYAGTNDDLAAGGGGAPQIAAELAFLNWATGAASTSCNGIPGRCNLNPICSKYGFIPCLASCTATIPTSNLCNMKDGTGNFAGMYPPAAATTNNCFPNSQGGQVWNYSGTTCSAAGACCTTNAVCNSTTPCVALAGLPNCSACSKDSDCLNSPCAGNGAGINTCTGC